MKITSNIEGDICIFFLDGNLDTATAGPAEEQIQTDLGDYKKAVFDLSKTAYVSSAGLRVFLITAKKIKAQGGEIRLCNANATVDEILTISGFKTILNVNADVAEATSALQG